MPLLISAFPSDIPTKYMSWLVHTHASSFLGVRKSHVFFSLFLFLNVLSFEFYPCGLLAPLHNFLIFTLVKQHHIYSALSLNPREHSNLYSLHFISLCCSCKLSWQYTLSCEWYLVKTLRPLANGVVYRCCAH